MTISSGQPGNRVPVSDVPVDPDSSLFIEQWDRSRLADVVALCALAFDGDTLGEEDLDLLVFGDASESRQTVVLGTVAGDAVVVVTSDPARAVAQVQLVVVHPARRRRGRAGSVVAAAEDWARSQGVGTMQVGAAAPFYVFSGVDTRWTEALCLFESLGYARTDVVLDLVCPTMQNIRRARPPGLRVDHVETDEQVEALDRFSAEHFPQWAEEFARAGESGTAVLAVDTVDGSIQGAAAHSVSRFGVIGPMAVAPDGRRGGIGTALVGAVLTDLSTAGLRTAEIAWTSTVGFYAKACGAKVGRASQIFRRDLAEPDRE